RGRNRDCEPSDDLDDADEVHEVLCTPGSDAVDPAREVVRPVHRPVEELVQPEQDRRSRETDTQQHVRLVGGVRTRPSDISTSSIADTSFVSRGRPSYAITSTFRSFGSCDPSSARTSLRARIETSIWSSEGCRVVSRCSQRPGASSVIKTRFSWCLPAKRISS